MEILERQIDVGGLTVQLWEAGQGRAIMLLHGGIGDACANWHLVLPGLAEQYHVIAPNLPGYGLSTPLPDMTIETLQTWLRDLLDALELPDAVIVGAFIGALIARLFATAEPAYTPAVILVNGGALPNFPKPLSSLLRLPVIGDLALELFGRLTTSRRTLDELIYVKSALSPELVASWQHNQPGFQQLIRAMILGRYPPTSTPPVPILLLWGANDPMLAQTVGQELRQQVPNIVLAPIVDCGALPQLEAPDTFVFQINAFLDNLDRPRLPNSPGAGLLSPH